MVHGNLSELIDLGHRRLGEWEALQAQIAETDAKLATKTSELATISAAEGLLKGFATWRRELIKGRIEAATTGGLQQVFGDEYSFVLGDGAKTGPARNAALRVRRGEHEANVTDAFGCGIWSVISFLLWVVVSSLAQPPPTRFVVFDEPFTNLTKDRLALAQGLLQGIVDAGWQTIIITNEPTLVIEDEAATDDWELVPTTTSVLSLDPGQ